MTDIVIYKKDDVYARIDCVRSIAEELNEYFSFYVDGFQFTPKYKNKQWDGKIRLFRTFDCSIYIGLISHIVAFAESRGYSVSIEPKAVSIDKRIDEKLIDKFVSSLNLHCGETKIEAYDYQKRAVCEMLRNKRGLILSPTSSGKSLIVYIVTRFLQNITNKKILILVPTTGLVLQMYSDFADYSTHDSWDVADNCHQIMSGKDKYSDKQVYISTWQSIFRMPPKFFDMFDAIICDECHLATANSIQKIMNSLTNCPYKFGLTGTLSGAKTNELTLNGLFGDIYKVITTKELMDAKKVADLSIRAVVLKYPQEICQNMKKVKYQDEMKWLYENANRNLFIARSAVLQKRNCLLLFNHKRHGKILFETIKNMVDENRTVYFIDGSVSADKRDEIRKSMEQKENAILIASLGTSSTGVSIKNIHSVFFCSPSKSKIRTLQSIGRGLRMNAQKTDVVLYDICDDLSWKSRQNYSLQHFIERVKYYNDEKFDYTVMNVEI